MIKRLAFPALFPIAFLIKNIIVRPNIADSIIFIGSLVIFGFMFFIENKKEKPINQEVKEEIELVKKELGDIKTFINVTKLSSQFRVNK